ncbi:Galactose/methyl galactoside import ATP-binding protein MglA [Pararobbsia alpina]|uniref:Galactose/methyl galactoside import ATP-binding protein MglA n=2 Tax=Pararobbsia alpina TaxID=621374 RepID=A0A6S7AZ65_9BURK|nr:Galactose/methyl galactoside import ATP-binding protein MglA [Pararobbsia alpina]
MEVTDGPKRDLLEVSDLRKSYGPTIAVGGVSFSIRRGEVHALLGENGAGKSTLVKILSGVVPVDAGSMTLNGTSYQPASILDARAKGVSTAFQEHSLLTNLTVAENLALPTLKKGIARLVSRRGNDQAAEAILHEYDLAHFDPRTVVSALTLADRQRLEIVRALSKRPKLLILDEPTAVLASTDWLFALIRTEIARGTSVLYISHRLNEIRELCARGTVLRSGKSVATTELKDTDDAAIFEMMVGSRLASFTRERVVIDTAAEPRLHVNDLSAGMVRNVGFNVPAGSVVGLAGLDGQGQADLFHALFGLKPLQSGEIKIDGKAVRIKSPAHALRAGIEVSLLPEERKTQGIFPTLSVQKNMTLSALRSISSLGVVRGQRDAALARKVAAQVDLQERYVGFQIGELSGGNQQKALLGRVLMTGARTLLLFDPTRGVDVGTKQAIYKVIQEYARSGGAVLMYSSELSELVQLCDECLVIYGGRIVSRLEGEQIDEKAIIAAATGHREDVSVRAAA